MGEVRIPLDKFVATAFGRVVRNQPLDPSAVNGLGILLGDKQAGPSSSKWTGSKAISHDRKQQQTNSLNHSKGKSNAIPQIRCNALHILGNHGVRLVVLWVGRLAEHGRTLNA